MYVQIPSDYPKVNSEAKRDFFVFPLIVIPTELATTPVIPFFWFWLRLIFLAKFSIFNSTLRQRFPSLARK